MLLKPRWKVRVLDPVSGAVIIDPLPQPHTAQFNMIFSQAGASSSTAIGTFQIPLFPPWTNEYAWAKTDYDKLSYMQRVEFYLSDNDAAGVLGTPRFTGVITELPKDPANFAIRGQDSVYLLQVHRTRRAENWSFTTDALFKFGLKGYTLVFGDDFNSNSLSSYSNPNAWTVSAVDGFTALNGPVAGDPYILTTSSFANANYADLIVQAHFTLTCNDVGTSTVEGAVIAASSDANNYVMGRALLRRVGAGNFSVDAEILQKSGGVYTSKATVSNVYSNLTTNVWRGQVHLIGFPQGADYKWFLILDETDKGCTWLQTATTPSGSFGMRSAGTAGGSVYAAKNLVVVNKTALFANGTISVGTQTVNPTFSLTPSMDIIAQAISTEGFAWRKNPKAGLSNDTMDFAASIGTDLSTTVILKEKLHLQHLATEPNAEPLGTALAMAGTAGPFSFGLLHWYSVAAINKYGIVEDIGPGLNINDGIILRHRSDSILSKRSVPDQAKRLQILMTPDLVETPGTFNPTGLLFREGDQIMVDAPTHGLTKTKVTVMSIALQEGSPIIEINADQYPRSFGQSDNRMVEAVKLLLARAN